MYCTLNREVVRAVWPIWLGYLPLGFAGGVLSQKVGLTPLEIGVMSLLVFAGSGQFIALAMMGSTGSSMSSIVMTTFIVNLRHLLYSSTLAQYLMRQSGKYLGVFAQGITDETFAVNFNKFSEIQSYWDPSKALGVNIMAHGCWIFSNVLGNVVGNVIVVDTALVSYTLTAMFIGLWSFHFLNKKLIWTGILGGVLALILSNYLDHKLHIVVATVLAASIGCIVESWGKKS
jgi:4-azaleucine resistance transporter AzlC